MVALATAFSLIVAASASYEVSAAAQMRSRPSYNPSAFFLSGDLEVSPSGRIALATPLSQVALSYSPQMFVFEPYSFSSDPQILHRAALTAQTRFRHARLFAGEFASYGVNDFSTLAFTQSVENPNAVLFQNVPPNLRVAAANSNTFAGLWLEFSRSVQLELVGTYSLGGGLEDPNQASGEISARDVVPFQWGPGGYARLSLEASSTDTFRTVLRGSELRFSNVPLLRPDEPPPAPDYYERRPHYQTLELAEEWFRRLQRGWDTELGAGASAIRSQLVPGDPFQLNYYPVVYANAVHRTGILGEHAESRLGLRYAPFVDRFLGEIYPRAELTGQVEWPYRPNLRFEGRTGVGVALFGARVRGDVSGLLEARATYDLDRQWELLGSFLGAANRLRRAGEETYFQWTLGVGIRFHERGMF
jgi:hypothetical protein